MDETSALQLKSALITFHHLNGHYTGELLANTLIGLLDRAGITGKVSTMVLYCCQLTSFYLKVSHFTLDDVSNNGSMLTYLKTILMDCSIPTWFDLIDNQVWCYAHTIYLSCKAIVG